MPRRFRRVVTGHNAAGRSVFIMDGAAPAVFDRGPGRTCVTELWETRTIPADNTGNDEVTDHPNRLPPPRHGSVFRVVEYPPDSLRVATLRSPDESHDAAREGYVRDLANARHPGFHKTDTVDYAIVLSGEIYALMDEGEVLLKAGDVLVQRGTNHAWSNRTREPVQIAFVLIDAQPV
jgi:mannose-6-phosphate isomerase-like protein (cupin superfamily)